jgi:hypothetical protein
MSIKPARVAQVLSSLIIAFTATSAWARTFDEAVTALTDRVAAEFERHQWTTCSLDVSQTYSPGLSAFPGSGPSYVKEVFGRLLSERGIEVRRFRGETILSFELEVVGEEGPGTLPSISISLNLELLDPDQNPILSTETAEEPITDLASIARLLGVPFESPQALSATGFPVPDENAVPGEEADEELGTEISEGFVEPFQSVDGSIIRSRDDGQFGIEILVNGQGVPAATEDGIAYVELSQGDEFEVRIINNADFEVGAYLMIDGLDSFWFAERRQARWIIAPGEDVVVRGWQFDAATARKFQIVPFEESVAATAGATGNVGVISASFYPCRPVGRSYSPHAAGVGTGDTVVNNVNFIRRTFGDIIATVPVRYEKP